MMSYSSGPNFCE